MPTLHHLLLPLLLAPALALAELRWSVETSRYIDNWNGWAGIYECSEYVYLVSLDEGITCTLSTFTVPAGSDLGVYDAAAPEGWESHILPDCTVIHVTTGGVPIPATGGATFYLYSTLIGVNTNAWAEAASPYDGPFPPARVSVPAALPPRLTALAPATNGVWLALADLVVPRSSNTVQCAASPTGAWHAASCFVGTAPAINLWLPGTAPRAFFRVRSVQW